MLEAKFLRDFLAGTLPAELPVLGQGTAVCGTTLEAGTLAGDDDVDVGNDVGEIVAAMVTSNWDGAGVIGIDWCGSNSVMKGGIVVDFLCVDKDRGAESELPRRDGLDALRLVVVVGAVDIDLEVVSWMERETVPNELLVFVGLVVAKRLQGNFADLGEDSTKTRGKLTFSQALAKIELDAVRAKLNVGSAAEYMVNVLLLAGTINVERHLFGVDRVQVVGVERVLHDNLDVLDLEAIDNIWDVVLWNTKIDSCVPTGPRLEEFVQGAWCDIAEGVILVWVRKLGGAVFGEDIGWKFAGEDELVAVVLHIEHWKVDKINCVSTLHDEAMVVWDSAVARDASLERVKNGTKRNGIEPFTLSSSLATFSNSSAIVWMKLFMVGNGDMVTLTRTYKSCSPFSPSLSLNLVKQFP